MHKEKIEALFNHYLTAFKSYDLNTVAACYHLPCTLHTPDNLVFVNNKIDCQQEFSKIFVQLKQATTSDIIANKATYQQVSDHLWLVSIDWAFINDEKQVFADFCAIYHLIDVDGHLKIVNVVSHELSNSLTLKHTLKLD
ncbi:MAG: ketosteroid isomerase family protein [Colwellia sp.]